MFLSGYIIDRLRSTGDVNRIPARIHDMTHYFSIHGCSVGSTVDFTIFRPNFELKKLVAI